MNKLVTMLLVGGLALVGCGGGKKGDTTVTGGGDTTGDPAGGGDTSPEGTPCSQEIALECPEGEIDACLKSPPEGETHACVAQ